MPQSINGCGTMYCGYSAPIHWTRPGILSKELADHDAVVCFTIFMLPVIPLRPCHVFDHMGSACREAPLRWNRALTLRAYLRPWLFALIGIGVLTAPMAIFGAYVFFTDPLTNVTLTTLSVSSALGMLLPIGLLLQAHLNRVDQRKRDIRLILGRHNAGSSDPADWDPKLLKRIERGATTELLTLSREALRNRDFSLAMSQARLAVAHGVDYEGEALTDQILNDLEVQTFLPNLRKEPWRRAEWLK